MTNNGRPPAGDDPGRPGGSGEVGSVGEETARFFGALSDWARQHGGLGGGAGEGGGPGLGYGLAGLAGQAARAAREVDAHIATDDPECRWCPVCRTIHLVRQGTPEVRDQLAVAAAHLMQAAAGLLVAASAPEQRERSPGEHVQHIDLDGDPGDPGPGGQGP